MHPFRPLNPVKWAAAVASSRVYIFLAPALVFAIIVITSIMDLWDKPFAPLFALVPVVLLFFELTRFDRWCMRQLLTSFETWFIVYQFVAYAVFSGWQWFVLPCLLVGYVLALFMDAAPAYPKPVKVCFLLMMLGNTIKIVLQSGSDSIDPKPICFNFCTDHRTICLGVLTTLATFFLHYLLVTLVFSGSRCLIFQVPLMFVKEDASAGDVNSAHTHAGPRLLPSNNTDNDILHLQHPEQHHDQALPTSASFTLTHPVLPTDVE